MKKTIQEIRNKLFRKEILSEHDLLRLRGGDGEEDKRKDFSGGGSGFGGSSNMGSNSNSGGWTNNQGDTANNPGGG